MLRIVLDQAKCDGCRVCEVICSLVNEGECNPEKSRIRVVRTIENEIVNAIPVFCLQCEKAYCEIVCPSRAISRNTNGVLIIDEGKCFGCKLCEIACPVGAITVMPSKGIAVKCNQCADANAGEPLCVKYCYTGALQFLPAERVGKANSRARANKFLELERRS